MDWLVRNPDRLLDAWGIPEDPDHPDYDVESAQAHCLFQCLTPDGNHAYRFQDGKSCGCPVQIKCAAGIPHTLIEELLHVAWTDELTLKVLAEDGIPADIRSFVETFKRTRTAVKRRWMLAPFVRCQRQADKEIRGRTS